VIRYLLYIGIGGFAGSIARFLLSRWTNHLQWMSVPLGTLLVNIAGSFLIGLLIGISEKSPVLTVELRMLLMVGLCGGFTTFSTFTGENLMLMRNGQFLSLFLYTGMSILMGFTAVYFGYLSSKLMG
jgi:CrcB protein